MVNTTAGKKKPKQKHQPTRAAMNGTHARNASATKAGPGRFHQQGHEKASPIKPKGAPVGMVLHHASPEKRARRAAIKAFGSVRAFKRRLRYAAIVQAEIDARA
jgi:hypothetical protein